MKAAFQSRFRNLSLRNKLLGICAISSLVTLTGLLSISLYREWDSFLERKVSMLRALSEILESNTEAALLYQDPATAKEYVDSLKAEADLEAVVLYDEQGNVFSSYSRTQGSAPSEYPDFDGEKWMGKRLHFASDIHSEDGQFLGKLLIEMGTDSYTRFVNRSIWMALLLLSAGVGITLLLAARLIKLITEPIQELVEVTSDVTNEDTLERRARKRYNDEIGKLVDSFNLMLEKISKRDASLRDMNAELERKVEKRTVDLKKRNEELEAAMEAAKAASVAKSEFLATTSHELRTPLNPIIGYVEKLQRESKDDLSQKELGLIRQSAEQLLRLIDEILDFSRIERGKLKLSEDRVSYQEVCQNVVFLLEPQAAAKDVELTYMDSSEDGFEDVLLLLDEGRLRQVMLNLVNNAVKFTDKGFVRVRTRLTSRSDGYILRLTVEDTGIGISAENQKMLFKPFSQIDGSWTREYGGMGLGLAISQKIVNAMNGTIECESKEGMGSRFHVLIPVQPVLSPFEDVKSDGSEEALEAQNNAADILLVEDELVNRELMSALLNDLGHRVDVASNGLEALEMIEKESYDFILLDISMPKLDGFETSKRIRASNTPNKDVPIVAMTAHATPEDRERCVEVGMSDYLSKPVSFSKLKRMLTHWLGTSQSL
ncbi:response regulator [Pelagicoccus sp. SDUM812003]|uniref:response regulator n=1 Tax=Pelagicoccus sp. SDUM812003 TaxID=3041267 RepID=UPI00280D2351|nr:response regulator [Pelagicoccus sp. SDUM812003]MDQ8204602.1 response regulator [Pelagicoccus sp. SDUM812003]